MSVWDFDSEDSDAQDGDQEKPKGKKDDEISIPDMVDTEDMAIKRSTYVNQMEIRMSHFAA